METQGHVSATRISNTSLRSLVSRTQKAPEDYPQAETKKVTPASEPSQGETDAVGKGLQAAAAALDKVEKTVPVQSLLTRTLGQPTTKLSPENTVRNKEIYSTAVETKAPLSSVNTKKKLEPLSLESAKNLTVPQPKRWNDKPDVRLTPRYSRPHTENASLLRSNSSRQETHLQQIRRN